LTGESRENRRRRERFRILFRKLEDVPVARHYSVLYRTSITKPRRRRFPIAAAAVSHYHDRDSSVSGVTPLSRYRRFWAKRIVFQRKKPILSTFIAVRVIKKQTNNRFVYREQARDYA